MAGKRNRKLDETSHESSDSSEVIRNYIDKPFAGSELVIGLVGAVGTELKQVVDIITERLHGFNYKDVTEIRISKEVIPQIPKVELPKNSDDEYTRIDMLMTAGDECRRNSSDNSILALGAAALIAKRNRLAGDDTPRNYRPRHAYIINSLKHPDEVVQLRQIYPLGFYLFGVYAEEKRREDYLFSTKQIPVEKARNLMKRDEDENTDYGQRVKDTFHMSDFFVRLDDSQDQLRNSLWRILDIMFGHPHETPTFDEYAMFLAHVAALRSSSLSRQVGTVIAKNNEIIATGANDCPKYGGGLYWPYFDKKDGRIKDEERGRDHMRGEDSNKIHLQEIKTEIIRKAGLSDENEEKLKKALDTSSIKDLTEFGRAVHAEMEALLSCARNHGNTRGATLYTSTFSCHNCARHIIAAGIERVVYIEPYPKSKAIKLHDEAISLEFFDANDVHSTVCFEPFVGVGPRRFFDLFSMSLGSGSKLIRKDPKDKPLQWDTKKGNLRLQMLPSSYLGVELNACDKFWNFVDKQGDGK